MNIIIESVNLINKSTNNVYSVNVLVKDKESLNKYITGLTKIDNVNDVERIMR